MKTKAIFVLALVWLGIFIFKKKETRLQRPAVFEACPEISRIRSKWDLWAHGVCLRGANIWQKRVDREKDGETFGHNVIGPPYLQQDFDRLAELGANAVFLSFPGLASEIPPYRWDERSAEYLDRLLRRLERADLFAIIGFRTGPGRTEEDFSLELSNGNTHSLWTDPYARRQWVEMWQETARRYRKNKNVVGYQLMVEPNANQALFKIWDPGVFYSQFAGTQYDWNEWAKELIGAIRAEDAETPILVCSMDLCSPKWLERLELPEDEKLVSVFHQYEPLSFTSQAALGNVTYPGSVLSGGMLEKFDLEWISRLVEPVRTYRNQKKIPVAVGEYGVIRWAVGAENFLKDQLQVYESEGMNHFVWLWETSWPHIDYDQFNLRHGTVRSNVHNTRMNPLLSVLKQNWRRNYLGPKLLKGRF